MLRANGKNTVLGFGPMLIAFWSTGARLLLSLTLLVNGIGAPAFQHAHAEGDEPHSHDATAKHSHSHDHDCADHHHHGTKESASRQLTSSVAHVHLSWFGFEFTLPAQDGSEQTTDGMEDTTALVNLHDDFVQATPARSALFRALPAPRVAESIIILSTAGHFSCTAADSAPLCDTARHERSGVQLS